MSAWNEAQKKSMELRQRRIMLEARKAIMEKNRKNQLDLSIKSQERIQSDELVKEVLNRLQQREHERAVGSYEKLLGAFLNDVLPGERHVVMDLHTDRSAPALDIYIKKGSNEPLEDALSGTGGSVTNLLSTGLRLIALLRSGNRRFLILDESDCWIEKELIPKYAAIVSQMSRELGVQILMISHNQESLFEDHIKHRLQLVKKNSGLLVSNWSPTSEIPEWEDDQKGLRSIILKDFQSHQNTIINLSPEITLLQGKNDIGKSAIVNSFRAIFDGDANDTLIKHGATSTQVTLDFGPENILTWQRFLKGKIKTTYKLYNHEDMSVIHATDGTKVPQWVWDNFKIGKVDGLDIQIGQQKEPVFLLNQPASVRAKALSIGQESGHVNEMILIDRQELQEAKSILKNAEKELELARREQFVFEKLVDFDYQKFDQAFNQSINKQREIEKYNSILKLWKRSYNLSNVLSVNFNKNLKLPEQKSFKYQDILNDWIILNRKTKILDLIKETKNIKLPEQKAKQNYALLNKWKINQYNFNILINIKNSKNISIPKSHVYENELLNDWIYINNKVDIISKLKFNKISLPILNNKDQFNNLNNWKNKINLINNLKNQVIKIEENENNIKKEIHEKFPICPTCNQKWD